MTNCYENPLGWSTFIFAVKDKDTVDNLAKVWNRLFEHTVNSISYKTVSKCPIERSISQSNMIPKKRVECTG